MSYEAMAFWVSTLNVLFTAGLSIYVRLAARSQAKEAALTAFRKDVDDRLDAQNVRILHLENSAHPPCAVNVAAEFASISERVVSVENRIEHSPSHQDMARLHARIDESVAAIKRVEGENAAQTRILNLVYESLISRNNA